MAVEKVPDIRFPLEIEKMRLEDVGRVVELDEKCFPTPWSASAYTTEVHNTSAYYIVARTDGKIIGFAGMWLIMDEAHITTLGVDPEYRGCRIGERILVNLLDEAVHRGARRVTLEVREHNLVAQNLYKKYGFHVAAVRKGYYTDNNENALVMWIDDLWTDDFLKTYRQHKEKLGEV